MVHENRVAWLEELRREQEKQRAQGASSASWQAQGASAGSWQTRGASSGSWQAQGASSGKDGGGEGGGALWSASEKWSRKVAKGHAWNEQVCGAWWQAWAGAWGSDGAS